MNATLGLPTYLKAARRARNMSVRELARAADIDYATIYRLENGETENPWPETLAAIAHALGVEAEDLWVEAGLMSRERLGRDTQLPPTRDPVEMLRESADWDDEAKAALIPLLEQLRGKRNRRAAYRRAK